LLAREQISLTLTTAGKIRCATNRAPEVARLRAKLARLTGLFRDGAKPVDPTSEKLPEKTQLDAWQSKAGNAKSQQPRTKKGLGQESLFAYKSFVVLVPGGGVEPPRPCGRRILSPILVILQRVAWHRTRQHNSIHCNI
jgi:hypothetical protein